jgi:hypothetical protein
MRAGCNGVERANRFGQELYQKIRKSESDIEEITLHTGLKRSNLAKIKAHLFLEPHWLDSYESLGVPGAWTRFDSDLTIAEAWNRLRTGKHGPVDLQLLRHEAAEAWYMRRHGPIYRSAHLAAQRRFPRPDELWDQQ